MVRYKDLPRWQTTKSIIWPVLKHHRTKDHIVPWRPPPPLVQTGKQEGVEGIVIEKDREKVSTLTPTPSDRRGSATTCLASEEAVKEASLWWGVGAVHVQVGAQRPVRLIHVDLLEALHLNHLGVGGHREGVTLGMFECPQREHDNCTVVILQARVIIVLCTVSYTGREIELGSSNLYLQV